MEYRSMYRHDKRPKISNAIIRDISSAAGARTRSTRTRTYTVIQNVKFDIAADEILYHSAYTDTLTRRQHVSSP